MVTTSYSRFVYLQIGIEVEHEKKDADRLRATMDWIAEAVTRSLETFSDRIALDETVVNLDGEPQTRVNARLFRIKLLGVVDEKAPVEKLIKMRKKES